MMVRLTMVAQVNQKDVSLSADRIVEGKVAPHATLAHEAVEEQNGRAVRANKALVLEGYTKLAFALVSLGRGDLHTVELHIIA